jgi:hypothetical protein
MQRWGRVLTLTPLQRKSSSWLWLHRPCRHHLSRLVQQLMQQLHRGQVPLQVQELQVQWQGQGQGQMKTKG